MTKFLALTLLLVATCTSAADVAHDEVTLLQQQAEVKKKAAKQAASSEDNEEATYDSATSCDTSEKVAQPLETNVEAVHSDAAQTTDATDKAPLLTVSSALQVMAILLFMNVMRSAGNRKSSPKESAGQDSSKEFLTAVLKGDEATFHRLLSKSLSQATSVDSWGCTFLHYAAKGGSANITRKIAALDVSVNAQDAWDETPLHLAARAGHVEACDALLVAGADVNSANAEECTPLIVAGRAEHEAVCRLLISSGADVKGLDDAMVPKFIRLLLKEQEEEPALA